MPERDHPPRTGNALQKRVGAVTPRWFHEGHAEWVGRQVTRAPSPTHADQHAADDEDALARTTVAIASVRRGGVAVKREALLRQLSPKIDVGLNKTPGSCRRNRFRSGQMTWRATKAMRQLVIRQLGASFRSWPWIQVMRRSAIG